jgi:hypothetical protein
MPSEQTIRVFNHLIGILRPELYRVKRSLAMQKMMDGLASQPCGVIVAEYSQKNNIPIVFNTDINHHDLAKVNLMRHWRNALEIIKTERKIGDRIMFPWEDIYPQKDWKKIYTALISQWEKREFVGKEPHPQDVLYKQGLANFEKDYQEYQEEKNVLRKYGVE